MTGDNFKKRLIDEKHALEQVIHMARDESRAVALDQGKVGRLSRMDALQKQAMGQEVRRRRQLQLKRIDAALMRIEEGEFGYCISCGEEIEEKRLKLNPSLPQCGICAAG